MSRRVWLPLALVAMVFAATVYLCGASFWIYFDLPSLLLVPIAPAVFMLLAYGWPGAASAIRAPLKAGATRRELAMSAAFWKGFGQTAWGFGAMGSALGLIAVLANLTDRTKVGPNAAIALITMLYAALFNVGLVLPFQTAARKRAMEMDT